MLQRKNSPTKSSNMENGTKKGTGIFKFQFPIDLEYDPNKSISQKWNEYFYNKSMNQSESPPRVAQGMMRLLMAFQAPTQMYAFMFYILPYVFEDYNPWTLYYMEVLCWFIMMNGLANYFCVILYDPSYPKSKDNPYMTVNQQWDNPPDQFVAQIEQASSQNGHCVYDMTSKEALPWNFCEKCAMHVPPRSHHCNFCKKCIMKRDHHCFMVGNCIGFKNQRYFIVLAFYAMVTGIVGALFTHTYVKEVYWPSAYAWTDLVLPITIYRWIFGSTLSIHALLVFHMYTEIMFGFIGFVYFTSQMTIVSSGKTLFELSKGVPIKSKNSFSRNLTSVFGDFWLLNFLFPMTLIFRQRDDGIHWDGIKVDHNANEKWKDDGEIL